MCDINVQPLGLHQNQESIESTGDTVEKDQPTRVSVIKHTGHKTEHERKIEEYEKFSGHKRGTLRQVQDYMEDLGENSWKLIGPGNDIMHIPMDDVYPLNFDLDDNGLVETGYGMDTFDQMYTKEISLNESTHHAPCTCKSNEGSGKNQQQALYITSPGTNQLIINFLSPDCRVTTQAKEDSRKKEFSCNVEGCDKLNYAQYLEGEKV